MFKRLFTECRYRLGGRYQLMGQYCRAFWYRQFFSVGKNTRLAKGLRFEGKDFSIGDNCKIEWDTTLFSPVSIGNNCYINQRCVISQYVTIEDNVGIGAHTLIYGDSREVSDDPNFRAGKGTWKPVHIGKGAMIGACVTIMQGVTIGQGAVIAAGAVVIADCDANGVYAGVPAKKIKSLPPS
jgi:acetyltransferase-like isoleucine patch superfamily enzyme